MNDDLIAWWKAISPMFRHRRPDEHEWATIMAKLDDALEDPNDMAQRHMDEAFRSGRLDIGVDPGAVETHVTTGMALKDDDWERLVVEQNAPRAVEGELLTDDRGRPTEWQKQELKKLEKDDG